MLYLKFCTSMMFSNKIGGLASEHYVQLSGLRSSVFWVVSFGNVVGYMLFGVLSPLAPQHRVRRLTQLWDGQSAIHG